jgi:hypothetical protein
VGDGEGAGEERFARFGALRFACFGMAPEAVNDTSFGVATLTGVTADGADAFSLPPPAALPMPNAAPKATTTATTAIAAKRPGLIGRCRSRRP